PRDPRRLAGGAAADRAAGPRRRARRPRRPRRRLRGAARPAAGQRACRRVNARADGGARCRELRDAIDAAARRPRPAIPCYPRGPYSEAFMPRCHYFAACGLALLLAPAVSQYPARLVGAVQATTDGFGLRSTSVALRSSVVNLQSFVGQVVVLNG